MQRHYGELATAGAIHRDVESQVLARFVDCGDLHKGFARIYCDGCGHDYLLAFSCKTRYFCPSCHQKRMLAYGEWVEDEVLNPVPHRQYVFTLPKLLRPHFHLRRRLSQFCRIVSRLLADAYREVAPWGRPGFILFVQTFGDLVNFHPHIHVLVTDGVFSVGGTFLVLPPVPGALLEQQLRKDMLGYLVEDEAISMEMAENLRT
ncbi:transposase zinc-binding domain-containing protein [endosymbiont of Lamellibrachia barhami]|uniref:transposase zinc-binding domain-containing protein n=1 Tax=endosymbiont of Lamellibrachia barhami TaxID=205975 RepID=UPI0015A7F968